MIRRPYRQKDYDNPRDPPTQFLQRIKDVAQKRSMRYQNVHPTQYTNYNEIMNTRLGDVNTNSVPWFSNNDDVPYRTAQSPRILHITKYIHPLQSPRSLYESNCQGINPHIHIVRRMRYIRNTPPAIDCGQIESDSTTHSQPTITEIECEDQPDSFPAIPTSQEEHEVPATSNAILPPQYLHDENNQNKALQRLTLLDLNCSSKITLYNNIRRSLIKDTSWKIGVHDEEICSICCAAIKLPHTIRLLYSCDHFFHVKCIDSWLQDKDSCPVCRGSIRCSVDKQKEYERLSFSECSSTQDDDIEEVFKDLAVYDEIYDSKIDEPKFISPRSISNSLGIQADVLESISREDQEEILRIMLEDSLTDIAVKERAEKEKAEKEKAEWDTDEHYKVSLPLLSEPSMYKESQLEILKDETKRKKPKIRSCTGLFKYFFFSCVKS